MSDFFDDLESWYSAGHDYCVVGKPTVGDPFAAQDPKPLPVIDITYKADVPPDLRVGANVVLVEIEEYEALKKEVVRLRKKIKKLKKLAVEMGGTNRGPIPLKCRCGANIEYKRVPNNVTVGDSGFGIWVCSRCGVQKDLCKCKT